jgi:hypothetical protein
VTVPAVGLIALVVSAIVIALYLVRLNRRRVVVSDISLWSRALGAGRAGRTGARFERPASLALQLAFIGCVAAALGVWRRPATSEQEASTYVFVLDCSASMAANEGSISRLTLAKRALTSRVVQVPEESKVALVMNMPPWIVVPPTRLRSTVIAAIERVRVVEGRGDLATAMAQAAAWGAGALPASIELFTDGSEPLDKLGDDVRVRVVGHATANIGIITFGARPASDGSGAAEALVEVANFAARKARARLRVALDGRLVWSEPIALEPEGRVRRTMRGLTTSGAGELVAALENIDIDGAADALSLDDFAYAILPRHARTPLAIVDGSLPEHLTQALAALFATETIAATPITARPTTEVALVSGTTAPSPPRSGRYLVFNPQPATWGAGRATIAQASFTTWRVDHPIMRSVNLAGVGVTHGLSSASGMETNALAFAGAQALVWTYELGSTRAVVFGFDPLDSNLPLRASFPVLLANAVDWLEDETANVRQLQPGRAAVLGTAATVIGPDNRPIDMMQGPDGAQFIPSRVGFYRGRVLYAASLISEDESRIAPRPGAHARTTRPRTDDRRRMPPTRWWVVLAIFIGALEWALYHRRWTT